MNREKITSREYKVILRKEHFVGDERQLLKASKAFWQSFKQVAVDIVLDSEGDLEKIVDRREIQLYDTKKQLFYNKNYIFRERYDVLTHKREVTLKFRHLDRYVSQDRDMKANNHSEKGYKFEEDIKSPFLVLYSFSSTQTIPIDENFSKVRDVLRLYPSLSDEFTNYNEDENIKSVGNIILEIVLKGAKFRIRKNPQLDCKCALIVWYAKDDDEKPVVVEFSFRYGDDSENYTKKASQRAYDVFYKLQHKLEDWVDIESETKTSYIYKVAQGVIK
ncbi:hypothetical protein IQ241_05800 [Romeria aff. gracilis LEGE 07310]|uniref:CYTH domain-containing protein n=1 Tax=Vasconcelosia minhoensis LEGE 07310 TaxID=915328 RepID=A0A8J7AW39_9CYAN|nr:hypothetical protein [Romeria gracilis]MBE9076812.1 hypothetical protein [Romeria aff. gracilis LEGE 07310]